MISVTPHSSERKLDFQYVPGITGYAQVHGRDALTIKEKAKLDGFYIQNFSLKLDLKILLRTFVVVLKRNGYAEGNTQTSKNSAKDNRDEHFNNRN